MDELKKYINQNRDRLNIDEPGEEVWERIQKEFEPKKGLVIPMIIRWAAAACIILLAGFGAYFLIIDKDNSRGIGQNKPTEKVDTQKVKESRPIQEEQSKIFEDDLAENVAEGRIKKRLKPGMTKELDEVAKVERPVKATPSTPAVDPMSKAFNEMQVGYASMVEIQLEKIKSTPIYAEDANYFHVFKKQFQDLNNDERLLKQETRKTGINDDIISRMINIYQEKITLLKQLQFEISKMNNRMKNSDSDEQTQSPTYINL